MQAEICEAVGTFNNGADDAQPLAMGWNGTAWTIQSTPTPAAVADLSGISCSSATACVAVGEVTQFTGVYGPTHALVEVWNGNDWTVQAAANTTSDESQGLSRVSCSSPIACTAVGPGSVTAGPGGIGVLVPLVERYS
jgi:hypothetical protein